MERRPHRFLANVHSHIQRLSLLNGEVSVVSIETTDLREELRAAIKVGKSGVINWTNTLDRLEAICQAKIRDSVSGTLNDLLLQKEWVNNGELDNAHKEFEAVPVEAIQSAIEELQGGKK